jgi:hypothetical protein
MNNLFQNLESNIYDQYQTILFKYINNGELTKIVEDIDIPTHDLPDEIKQMLKSLADNRLLNAPDFLIEATTNAGNSSHLISEKDRFLREGKITKAYVDTYRGTGAIHPIGNFASQNVLINEGNVGLINWYLKQFDIFKLHDSSGGYNYYNFFNINKVDYLTNDDGSINYKLTYTTYISYNLFNYNFLKYLIIIYENKKTKIKNRTILRNIGSLRFKLQNSLINNTNRKIQSGILNLNDTDIDTIFQLFENYKDEILDFIFCYNLFFNDVQIIIKENIEKLSVAYQRYKIISEKYEMIHSQEDHILMTRGFTNEYKNRALSDDTYNRNKNIKLANFERFADYIQINIYKYISNKYDIFFNFCVRFHSLKYDFDSIISYEILKTIPIPTTQKKYIIDMITIQDWLNTLPNQQNLQQTDLDSFITKQNTLTNRVHHNNLKNFLLKLGRNINYFYPDVSKLSTV